MRTTRALLCLLPLALAAAPGRSAEDEPLPDPALLLERGRAILHADLSQWPRYAFRREVERRRLRPDGRVEWRTRYDFRVSPSGDGFDEQLVSIDGRAPTREEIRSHRRAARFTEHYRRFASGDDAAVGGTGLSLAYLLHLSNVRSGGRETVDGVACWRLDFEPETEPGAATPTRKLAAATTGSLWLAAQGLHLVRAKTRLVRPVARGPVRFYTLDVAVEGSRGEPPWLPRLIVVESEYRVALGRQRVHNEYRYSELRLVE